jgi:hypothetical protein
LDVSGEFVIERLPIKNQPLSSKQLEVRKVGLAPALGMPLKPNK